MTIEGIKIIIMFVGGLGLFIYGMHEMGEGLENAAGKKMQHFLEILTRNRFMAVITGALVTMAIQSSSATTVMVVGFVNAQLMNLGQAVGVIMGANIGTTVTSWIVASSEWATFLKPTTIAPLSVAVGVVMIMVSKKDKYQFLGQIFIGFGLLFMGIETMSGAVKPLQDLPAFQQAFIKLGTNPILGILAGTLITCILQSSSASVGILQSLALIGVVPWSAAVYIILGQNIGTCITAILSSIGTSKNAKAAAYIHLTFNVVGSLVFMFIALFYFNQINPEIAYVPVTATQISIFHSVFNISATVMLFPFANVLVKIASKMAGIDENAEQVSLSHLDDRLLESPSIATNVAFKEIVRMGEHTVQGFQNVSGAIIDKEKSDIDRLYIIERETNSFEEKISDYLSKLIRKPLSELEKTVITSYFHVINDFERVGDHLENIAELSDLLIAEDISFSGNGSEELIELIDVTNRCLSLTYESFMNNDTEKAVQAIELEDTADVLVKQFSDNHVKRLSEDDCNVRTGIIFLEVLTNLERISDHAKNVSEFVLANSNN